MPETTKGDKQVMRDGLTLAKTLHFSYLMPFRPNLLKTYMAVNHFTEVSYRPIKDGWDKRRIN